MSKEQQISTVDHNVKMPDVTGTVEHYVRKHLLTQADGWDAKRCKTEYGKNNQTRAISASTEHPSSALVQSLQAIEVLDETPIIVKVVYKDDVTPRLQTESRVGKI